MSCTLDLDIRDGIELPLDEAELSRICDTVLAAEGVERPCFVSLSVVDDDEMRTTNLEWRGIDATTDVISLECERPDDPDLGEGEPCELGDILLAPDYIAAQAKRLGTTAADECRLLLVHGLLHLLGYDHLVDEEAEVMEAREDELVAQIKTDGSLAGVRLTRHEDERS